MKALVLSGGGARGAYQVGVLKVLGEVARDLHISQPFQIMSGASAGAINAGFLAAQKEDFYQSTVKLAELWQNISSTQVFKTDALSIGKISLKWIKELSLGGAGHEDLHKSGGLSLLNTDPLIDLLVKYIDFTQIQKNIDSNKLSALAISALNYETSETITFIQGSEKVSGWKRGRRRSEKTMMGPEHIMASSAIPILFPPRPVGSSYFGDGCVRNNTPLSPAIHCGAQEIFVIGVRTQEEAGARQITEDSNVTLMAPSIARITNVLLNAVLLDGIEVDLERLSRINDFMSRIPKNLQENLNFRSIPHLFVHPSEDIGDIAFEMSSHLPRVIRYLLKGLGPLDEAQEIMSYLLFEKDFTSRLIAMGYSDGLKSKDRMIHFLKNNPDASVSWDGF